jgi:hypothetical protein
MIKAVKISLMVAAAVWVSFSIIAVYGVREGNEGRCMGPYYVWAATWPLWYAAFSVAPRTADWAMDQSFKFCEPSVQPGKD